MGFRIGISGESRVFIVEGWKGLFGAWWFGFDVSIYVGLFRIG